MKYSKGICWISDCRIPFVDTDPLQNGISGRDNGKMDTNNQGWGFKRLDREPGLGRFTPNLLVCDNMLNDGVVTQYNKTREDNGNYLGGHRKEYVGTTDNDVVKQIKGQFFKDKGTNSRFYDLDKWFDKIIDGL